MRESGESDEAEAEMLAGLSPTEARAALARMIEQAVETELAVNGGPKSAYSQAEQVRSKLTTAAALIESQGKPGESPAPLRPSADPDQFLPGLAVQHPEYGLGKIMDASGIGPKRTVTVAFVSAAAQKKFLVVHSPLTLAKS
jgi:hypothetical protein